MRQKGNRVTDLAVALSERVGEAFEIDRDRKALVVQATGEGKTRTAIALSDLLMRCN